jgi:predicted RNA methylase
MATTCRDPEEARDKLTENLSSTSENKILRQITLASIQASVSAARKLLTETQDMVDQLIDGLDQPTDSIRKTVIQSIPRWHFPMLNDFDRNQAFSTALKRVVPVGAHVLDIGSGTGLLAMMAAKTGAASVTTCEANPLLAELSRQIIAQHGLSEVITVIPKNSTDLLIGVDLPRRVDLIVSEIVDCGLVGEGVLPTIRHAREYLLVPGGRLLPESARMVGALVDSAAIDKLNHVRTAAGFDIGLFNEVATKGHFPVRLSTWPHRLLSRPMELVSFDFAADPLSDDHVALDIPVSVAGQAHAMIAWFEMTLGGGVLLRNSPDNSTSHWMQACIPFPSPVSVQAGESIELLLSWQQDRLSVQHLATFRL